MEGGESLFGLYLIQIVGSFHKLLVSIQQLFVFRMVVSQNHTRIDNVLVEVDFCSLQSQSVMTGITVEPALVQAVANGFAVVVRITDVEHHRCVLPEELLQHAGNNLKDIVVLRRVGLAVVGDEENNTETVRVSAGKNPTSEPRYATLTVKGGKAPEKYVMVTQLAGTVVPEVKTLTADVSSLTFEAKGEAKTIKIASNTTWSITGKPEWCLLSESSGSGSRDITVTANENTMTEDRSGQIVIEGDGVSKVVIDVTQKAKELQEPGSNDNTPPA